MERGRWGAARKAAGLLGAVALLSGCASSPPPWSMTALALRQADAAQTGPHTSAWFDFSWVLSGDRQAAPLQVFDDGQRMWLQFSPSQSWPQLFGHTPQGWVALDYTVQGVYVVLDALWPQVQVRAGGREALVVRQNEKQREAQRIRAQQTPAPAVM